MEGKEEEGEISYDFSSSSKNFVRRKLVLLFFLNITVGCVNKIYKWTRVSFLFFSRRLSFRRIEKRRKKNCATERRNTGESKKKKR